LNDGDETEKLPRCGIKADNARERQGLGWWRCRGAILKKPKSFVVQVVSLVGMKSIKSVQRG
jgi:hypothetical protein